jgi:hypothetical protein
VPPLTSCGSIRQPSGASDPCICKHTSYRRGPGRGSGPGRTAPPAGPGSRRHRGDRDRWSASRLARRLRLMRAPGRRPSLRPGPSRYPNATAASTTQPRPRAPPSACGAAPCVQPVVKPTVPPGRLQHSSSPSSTGMALQIRPRRARQPVPEGVGTRRDTRKGHRSDRRGSVSAGQVQSRLSESNR